MSQSIPKSKDVRAKLCMQRWMPLLILAILLTSCINAAEEIENGIVFIASRGKRPVAQSIAWSPIDENKVLIRAYETPSQPAEVYILDVQTGEKELVVGPLQPAQFIDAKWMPDGKYALILVVDTIGFEPSGWWVRLDRRAGELGDGHRLVDVERALLQGGDRTLDGGLDHAQDLAHLAGGLA